MADSRCANKWGTGTKTRSSSKSTSSTDSRFILQMLYVPLFRSFGLSSYLELLDDEVLLRRDAAVR